MADYVEIEFLIIMFAKPTAIITPLMFQPTDYNFVLITKRFIHSKMRIFWLLNFRIIL